MHYLTTATLLIVAIIHLLPVSGALGAAQLEKLYGMPLTEPNLTLLMRHRAVLFGLLGLFLAYAAFTPSEQALAFIAGFISVVSFMVLARDTRRYTPQIRRVFKADVVALVCLVIGGVAFLSDH